MALAAELAANMLTPCLPSRISPADFLPCRQDGLAPELRRDGPFPQPLVNTRRVDRALVRAAVTKTEQIAVPPFSTHFDHRPLGNARPSPGKSQATNCARQARINRLGKTRELLQAVFGFNSHTFNNRVTLAKYGPSSLSIPRLRRFRRGSSSWPKDGGEICSTESEHQPPPGKC